MSLPGPSYMIGQGASATNTVEPGNACSPFSKEEDTVKEGTELAVLRLNTSETAVKIGGGQALLVETANDSEFI